MSIKKTIKNERIPRWIYHHDIRIVSREFEFGLELNDDELRRVIEQRQSREWDR